MTPRALLRRGGTGKGRFPRFAGLYGGVPCGWRCGQYGGRRRAPLVIGLTGSIGMGKSAVAKMFRRFGLPHFDADHMVRMVQGPGGRALPAIEARFPGVTGENGLDRAVLGQRVFGDEAALRDLERIVHPVIEEMRRAFLHRHRHAPAVLMDVPLLLEGESHRHCDLVCVVSAPWRVQRGRVLARPGMTEERFCHVVANQLPDAEKRRLADVVIETGRGRLLTWRTVRSVVEGACGSAGGGRYRRYA